MFILILSISKFHKKSCTILTEIGRTIRLYDSSIVIKNNNVKKFWGYDIAENFRFAGRILSSYFENWISARWRAAAVHCVARRLEYFRSDLAAVDACVMAAARQPDAFHLHRSYWRINRQITVESSVEYPGQPLDKRCLAFDRDPST